MSPEVKRRRRGQAAFERKEANRAVIKDTLDRCSEDPAMVQRGHVCWLPGRVQREPCEDLPGKASIEIEIRNEDCVSVAEHYCRKDGASVWLLNLASASRPGGGVRSGCNAQEEHLCRCSTLLPHLERAAAEGQYPLHRWRGKKQKVPDCGVLVHDEIEFLASPSWAAPGRRRRDCRRL